MTSIADRDRQGSVQSTPEKGIKGLFGRKKEPKKEEKVVIGSNHTALVKNKLKADPRGARKHPSMSTKTAGVVGTSTPATRRPAHLTAEQQEMRHPHSGPPTTRGAADLPMLTRIVSGDEDDEWDQAKRAEWEKKKLPVLETHGEEEKVADVDIGGVEDLQARRKSLLDVEIKGGEGIKPGARRKTVFGGWAKDSKGIWTRG
jgi:hypothetical protein